ncbi:MAG: hypothetical protein ACRD68_10080, partial [Pyrinomonadaceae bacterium]
MTPSPENKTLIAHLTRTFGELSAPLDASIRSIWRGPGSPPAGRTVLDNQLLRTAQQFVDLKGGAAGARQQYYEQICRHFRLSCAGDTFPLRGREDFDPQILARFDRTPVLVSYLSEYDARHGTNYADRARHALFELANLIIKFDGRITPVEESALAEFKETLYPSGKTVKTTAQTVAPDADARKSPPAKAEQDGAEKVEEEQEPP